MSDQRLAGKVAIVTGSGRGIGAATAMLLASHGAKVVLTSRSEAELNAVQSKIEERSKKESWPVFYRPLVVKADVSNPHDVSEVFSKAKSQFGPIDILVNNAAAIGLAPFTELNLETWKKTLDVNLTGIFLCSKLAVDQMITAHKKGSIVNISSLAGVRGTSKFPGLCVYTTTKFGVVGFTESLAVEVKSHGIRVNCIAPGAVDTKMLHDAAPFLKTTTKPEDIAKAIFYFCDDTQSSKLSGSTLEVFSND